MAREKVTAPEVVVGQVWMDNDRRSRSTYGVGGRWLEVVGIEVRGASCLVYRASKSVEGGFLDTGRKTVVRLDRFHPTSTGYRLVKAVGSMEAP